MPIVRAPAVRYTLFTLHIVLWLAAFVLNLVMWGSISLLFLYAAAGLALVIYCPAAIILSARNSSSSFDHAGGEVAYIVVQMLIWLLSGVSSALVYASATWYGDNTPANYYEIQHAISATYLALAIVSLINFALLTGWMSWIVAVVHRQPNLSSAVAFRQPVHRLISDKAQGGYEIPRSQQTSFAEQSGQSGYAYNAPMPLGVQPIDPYADSGYNGVGQGEGQGMMMPQGTSREARRASQVNGDSRWATLPKLAV